MENNPKSSSVMKPSSVVNQPPMANQPPVANQPPMANQPPVVNQPSVVWKNRDSVFRMLFKEKDELLSLFNAIAGTHYEDPDELEITTLDNAIYMSIKNDISCVLDLQMHLYEHQSTVNPNMPLRYLMYAGALYEKWIVDENIYSSKRILLPTPRFVVLYNGKEKQPERRIMKLSDSYATDIGETNLEVVVLQLNINPGFNEPLKKDCQTLLEYSLYTERLRKNSEKLPFAEAVEKTVNECIRDGILDDFLRKNRAEVIRMSIFEFDEERYRKMMQKEYLEEGRAEGRRDGLTEGHQVGKATAILDLLNELGEIPIPLKEKILGEQNLDTLSRWVKLAAKAQSFAEFEKGMD